jgi:hypothetical protein
MLNVAISEDDYYYYSDASDRTTSNNNNTIDMNNININDGGNHRMRGDRENVRKRNKVAGNI